MKKKDRAARVLGRKRWKDVPKEERSRLMRDAVNARWRKRKPREET
jgi:hypothetical protein